MVTRKQVGQKIATAKNKKLRPEYDFYTTPVAEVEKALRELLPEADVLSRLTILDPCAGNGAFAKAIHNISSHWLVDQWDIVQRKQVLNRVTDFTQVVSEQEHRKYDIVAMNPPYTQAQEFVEKALEMVKEGGLVIAFLKLDFLAGRKRKALFSKGKLQTVLVNCGRVTCWPNDEKPENGSTTESAWFVFCNTPLKQAPTIKWID